MDIEWWIRKIKNAEMDAHLALAKHETSKSRVILMEDLSKQLSGAPIDVIEYFQESISCLEREFFRASIVMSWAGHFDVFVESLLTLHDSDLRSYRPKWKFSSTQELKEKFVEAQVIEAASSIGFISKGERRIVDGQLSTRNKCAHPTLYKPSLNSAIGYVDLMIRQTLRYLEDAS